LDLSIGAMMGLVGVVFVKMVKAGISVELSVLAVLAIAAFCGFVNGIIVAKSKVMPLIITLGMLYVYYGLALFISDGRPNALGDYFRFLGQSKLGPENFSIPFTIIVFLLIFLLAFAMNKYTKYGRRLNAIGGNKLTAYLAGINVDMHIISLYVLVGLIMGLAGLVLASRLGNVRAGSGDGYELKALAAVIIGGITFEGGKGSLIGVFFGVVLLGVIYNAMNLIGVSSYFQTMVLGAIIVVTTVISNIGKIRKA
jgi:ribose transport system permease protein